MFANGSISKAWQFKWLIWRLFSVEFFSAFRKTRLGFLWSLLMPMITVGAYVLLRLVLPVSHNPETEVHPMVYVVYGVTIWFLLSALIQNPISAVQKHSALLKETKLPIIGAILSGFGETLFNLFMRLCVVFPVLFLTGTLTPETMHYAALILLLSGILFFSIGLLIVPIWVFFPDVQQLLQIAFSYLIFFSLVIFPLSLPAQFDWFLAYNLMAQLIEHSRNALALGIQPSSSFLYPLTAASLGLFMFSIFLLDRIEAHVRDVI